MQKDGSKEVMGHWAIVDKTGNLGWTRAYSLSEWRFSTNSSQKDAWTTDHFKGRK